MSKSFLEVLAVSYRRHIDFPETHLLESDCITTKTFYADIYRLAGTKIHRHHFHVTGVIYGFADDFDNWKVNENRQRFTVFHYNLFASDFYLIVRSKTYCLGYKIFQYLRDKFEHNFCQSWISIGRC